MLQGDSSTLTVYIGRQAPTSSDQAPVPTSDQRRIYYWLSDKGLARQELLQVTSTDAANGTVPSDPGDIGCKLLAEEVKSLQFQYFDGSSWQDSWDGTAADANGNSPQGAPQAVAVTVEIARPDGEKKTYRHVIALLSANNPTPLQQNSSTGSSSGSSSGSGN